MTVQHMSQARALVWIVDDSPLDAARARAVLEQTYDVEVFGDGSAVLERLTTHAAPDVIVLDWVMPGVTGIEVCRFLREGPGARPELSILLLTMQTRTDDIVEGLAAGANDYLIKPYADPELRARVDALVRSSRLRERALKAEASVLELLEHAPDPLISVDGDGRISFANAEAQRIVGDATGRTLREVLPDLPVDDLAVAARTSVPLADLRVGERVFSPSVRALPSAERAVLTIALRDVTSRRLKEARRLDFYSIIAHDLRSPLGAMLMRTELMLRGQRGVLSGEVIGDLRKMEGNMRRLVALINDFLDLARMENAPHAMARSRVDLPDVIKDVVDEFRPLVDSTGQRVCVEVDRGAVAVSGDRSRLQQALTNLVTNAIKFTPAGGTIRVRARRLAATVCELSVEDDGPGVPPEILPSLFKRYSRAPSGNVAGGTGLGLLIVREIVEAHGGEVGVDSAVGRGSRFWARLPALDPVSTPAGDGARSAAHR